MTVFKKIWLKVKVCLHGAVISISNFAIIANILSAIKHFLLINQVTSGWFGVGYFLIGLFQIVISVMAMYFVGGIFIAMKDNTNKKSKKDRKEEN